MVKKKHIKGGVAIFDPSYTDSCNKTKTCNLQDINFTKPYAPANIKNLDDRGTYFTLNSDITGGSVYKKKSTKSTKKGGDFNTNTPSYFDVKNLNHKDEFKYTNYGNLDERGTYFSLSSDLINGGALNNRNNNLTKMFYKLVNNSYLNYKKNNKKLYPIYGGELGADNMSKMNTSDLIFNNFDIKPLEKINYAPKSNFQF